MADGIAIENIGDVPFALIKDYVDEIVLVNEDEIASAILTLLEVEKTVVEGSGACALAAVRRATKQTSKHLNNSSLSLPIHGRCFCL